jgi:hypothetical protein
LRQDRLWAVLLWQASADGAGYPAFSLVPSGWFSLRFGRACGPGFFLEPVSGRSVWPTGDRAMLETITADEVDLHGTALAVAYQTDPSHPELLLVSVIAHRTEADFSRIGRSELRLVVIQERMTWDAMHARVAAEAAKRGIERVAWIAARSQ